MQTVFFRLIKLSMVMNINDRLKTSVGGLEFTNPIFPASGTYGSGKEYSDFIDIGKLGAVVTKSVTPRATIGNPPPRVVETPSGMLNAIGLQNGGVDEFKQNLLPPLLEANQHIVVNVAGKSEDDYMYVVEALAAAPVSALEINISCPNVKEGGMAFGVCGRSSAALVSRLKTVTDLPLWIKLSPNVTDIAAIAVEIAAAGADALVVSNTYLGMAIDIEKRRPILANVTGGLSGPAIHPLALRCVFQVARAVSCPVIACGGIAGIREVVAFLLAGACACEVGMMNFPEPGITVRLIEELGLWLEEHDTTVAEIIGGLEI